MRLLYLRGFVNSAVIMIIIVLAHGMNFSSEVPAKAYAQENSTTVILEEMRTIMRDELGELSALRDLTSAEVQSLRDGASNAIKLSTQGAYVALCVFFLGIGLVLFGLRLTIRASPEITRFFLIMMGALTAPVIALLAIFQFGALTGTQLTALRIEEPFFLLSFLLYIPAGIILFLLIAHKRIVHAIAGHAPDQKRADQLQQIKTLAELKEQGLLTDEEFQRLKKAIANA